MFDVKRDLYRGFMGRNIISGENSNIGELAPKSLIETISV